MGSPNDTAREDERDDPLRLEAGLLRRSSVTVCEAMSWLLRSFQVAPAPTGSSKSIGV
jgi:hypothetical protein